MKHHDPGLHMRCSVALEIRRRQTATYKVVFFHRHLMDVKSQTLSVIKQDVDEQFHLISWVFSWTGRRDRPSFRGITESGASGGNGAPAASASGRVSQSDLECEGSLDLPHGEQATPIRVSIETQDGDCLAEVVREDFTPTRQRSYSIYSKGAAAPCGGSLVV